MYACHKLSHSIAGGRSVDHCSPSDTPRFSSMMIMGHEPSTKEAHGYLAKPSGNCCLKGTVHEGEARGSWEMIAEVETYIARPPEGEANGNILLYFPDVWGMFPNGFLVMDAFADAGYLVLGLDYFRGVYWPTSATAFWSFQLTAPRTLSGNTEKTVTIRRTKNLTMRRGNTSTQHSPISRYRDGLTP